MAQGIDKETVVEYCREWVEKKWTTANQALQSARQAAASEGKSTAGDKHETARAMAHLEQEKAARQLGEAEKLRAVLHRLEAMGQSDAVALGTLVETNRGWFFMAIPAGKMTFGSTTVFGVSLASPMGKALLGKRVGEEAVFNGNRFVVQSLS